MLKKLLRANTGVFSSNVKIQRCQEFVDFVLCRIGNFKGIEPYFPFIGMSIPINKKFFAIFLSPATLAEYQFVRW